MKNKEFAYQAIAKNLYSITSLAYLRFVGTVGAIINFKILTPIDCVNILVYIFYSYSNNKLLVARVYKSHHYSTNDQPVYPRIGNTIIIYQSFAYVLWFTVLHIFTLETNNFLLLFIFSGTNNTSKMLNMSANAINMQ